MKDFFLFRHSFQYKPDGNEQLWLPHSVYDLKPACLRALFQSL
jgi:hypothetical protein